jgi:hypothetical protein
MSHPFPVFGSQDLKDDDGQVIDSLLIETDTPPDIKTATEPIPATPTHPPIRTTRLISGTMTLDTNIVEPVLLLTEDSGRQQFRMDVFSNSATPSATTEYVMVADEKGKLQLPVDGSVMPGGLMRRVRHGKDFPLDVHTGAIWVRPNPGITGTIEITWAATTK